MLDGNHVVSILRWHKEDNRGNIAGGGYGKQLCLVMPAAERSLQHIIDTERINLNKVVCFAKDIGEALHYLHSDRKMVHADFKPRNIVRIGLDYKLIDFDAAVKVRT